MYKFSLWYYDTLLEAISSHVHQFGKVTMHIAVLGKTLFASFPLVFPYVLFL